MMLFSGPSYHLWFNKTPNELEMGITCFPNEVEHQSL